MPEVAQLSTPISETDAAAALRGSLGLLGEATEELGTHLLSQIWLETGRGRSMNNNNFGNITAGQAFQGDFIQAPWADLAKVEAMPESKQKDRLIHLHAEMIAGRAPRRFRAYPTKEAGMADYVGQLRRNFVSVVNAARSGDAALFARAIKESGYAPDINVDATARSVASLVSEFRSRGVFQDLPKGPSRRPADPSPPSPSPGSPDSSSGRPSESDPAPERRGDIGLPTLRLGSFGDAVHLWQKLMNRANFIDKNVSVWLPVKEDGDFGPKTYASTRAYQKFFKLEDDGVVSDITWGSV